MHGKALMADVFDFDIYSVVLRMLSNAGCDLRCRLEGY